MKALDTNVLVRFLTQDDPQQSRRANQYIERVVERGESCLINLIVLCEMVWVLESAYRYPKAAIVALVGIVLSPRRLCFWSEPSNAARSGSSIQRITIPDASKTGNSQSNQRVL